MSRPTAKNVRSSVRRVLTAVLALAGCAWLAYLLWRPGVDLRDGSHDLGRNAIWLAHGWLGGDEWFTRNQKTNEIGRYRDPTRIRELAEKLRLHGISDLFPHLCPAEPTGKLPPVDPRQVEEFLNWCDGLRVFPWIGGPNGSSVRLHDPKWRSTFVENIRELLAQHPRLAGVHLNIEPLPSGDQNFLVLLDEIRAVIPRGKILSIAAYPPPTPWHPYSDVHWEERYFRDVASRCDQLAVMMYDVAQKIPKTYQRLMADWTVEVLNWSEGKPVLLGVPTYQDAGVGYHNPNVENVTNALLGIHRGLEQQPLPTNYQGIAIYCEWETSASEWEYLREHFLKPKTLNLQ